MPDVRALIESAQVRGLRLFLDGDKVKVKAPQSLDEDANALIEEIRGHKEEIKALLAEDDPILPVEAWFPVFKELHRKVIAENRNFDFGWLRCTRPDLFQAIRGKESELDGLGPAPLSHVMAIMRQWRELMLQAEFERRKPKID